MTEPRGGSPPTTEVRPRPGDRGHSEREAGQATSAATIVAPATDSAELTRRDSADDVDVDRAGMRRVTLARTSGGCCHTCGRLFRTLAGAASHARANQHTTEGHYGADYLFAPVPPPSRSAA